MLNDKITGFQSGAFEGTTTGNVRLKANGQQSKNTKYRAYRCRCFREEIILLTMQIVNIYASGGYE